MRATCRAIAELSPHTNKATVARELAAIAGQKTAAQLGPTEIAQLIAAWHQRLVQPTRCTYHGLLKKTLKWLNRADLAELIPKLRDIRAHPPLAQPTEIDKLRTVAPAWLRAYITLATDAALRRSDALSISEQNIHDGAIHLIQFKTKQPVSIPASPAILELLENLPPGEPNQPIVERIAGRMVTHGMLQQAWAHAKKLAGVNPRLRPHSLRHTAAVTLFEKTKDLIAVQQFLGHSALSTTVGYLEHFDALKLKPTLQKYWTPKKPG